MAERAVTITIPLTDEDYAALRARVAHMNEFITGQGGQFAQWSVETELRIMLANGLAELHARRNRAAERARELGEFGITSHAGGFLSVNMATAPDWLRAVVDRREAI